MPKKPVLPESPLFDDFFDPVDALPYVPDPMKEAVYNDAATFKKLLEEHFENILLLLLQEYERVLREGGIRRRAEIVRRSAACECFADAPMDRKTRKSLAAFESDFKKVFSRAQMEFFYEYRRRLYAQYEWSIEYTRKFCEDMSRKKLRDWISIVYDE